jgi:hypothetical protein
MKTVGLKSKQKGPGFLLLFGRQQKNSSKIHFFPPKFAQKTDYYRSLHNEALSATRWQYHSQV